MITGATTATLNSVPTFRMVRDGTLPLWSALAIVMTRADVLAPPERKPRKRRTATTSAPAPEVAAGHSFDDPLDFGGE